MKGHLLFVTSAMIAGVFGALSGVLGKLGFTEEVDVGLVWRFALIACNMVCTAQMWRYYLKALSNGSTAVCSALSTGTNCAVCGAIGIIFFGEKVTLTWFIGAALCCAGLTILAVEDDRKASKKNIPTAL